MPNALKLGPRVTRTRANGGISTGAIAVLPCHQANTDTAIVDISGSPLGATAAGAAFVPATHFAGTDGVITPDHSGSSDFMQRVPQAAFTYDFSAGDALLIAGRIKLTSGYPASSRAVIAQGGNNTAAQGIRLSMTTAGALFMAWDGPSGTVFSANTDVSAASSGWVSYMFALWSHTPAAGTATYGIWLNGERAYTTMPKSASSLPTSMSPSEALRVGGYFRASGPVAQSIAATHANIHLYRAPASVPQTTAKMNALARRLFRDPFHPLTATEWPMA